MLYPSIKYCRVNNDIEATDELAKIRTSLKKIIDNKNLPIDYTNKITDIISFIDDAETEIRARLKVTKEYVDIVKLRIYEACESGDITESQRDYLLNYLLENLN